MSKYLCPFLLPLCLLAGFQSNAGTCSATVPGTMGWHRVLVDTKVNIENEIVLKDEFMYRAVGSADECSKLGLSLLKENKLWVIFQWAAPPSISVYKTKLNSLDLKYKDGDIERTTRILGD